ncbi:hypothetical protein F5B20DRAFT_523465 [Whalleya microplaca]|nr:hypothetical protein F5B20DRAFT_523465 [Whalleya microplaca]
MQPSGVVLAAAAVAASLPAAFAMQQHHRAPAPPTSVFEGSMASASIYTRSTVNATDADSLTAQAQPRRKTLTTAASAEKQALEASVMGLIVFSAAGLYLL